MASRSGGRSSCWSPTASGIRTRLVVTRSSRIRCGGRWRRCGWARPAPAALPKGMSRRHAGVKATGTVASVPRVHDAADDRLIARRSRSSRSQGRRHDSQIRSGYRGVGRSLPPDHAAPRVGIGATYGREGDRLGDPSLPALAATRCRQDSTNETRSEASSCAFGAASGVRWWIPRETLHHAPAASQQTIGRGRASSVEFEVAAVRRQAATHDRPNLAALPDERVRFRGCSWGRRGPRRLPALTTA
jgi:hypothetical protein